MYDLLHQLKFVCRSSAYKPVCEIFVTDFCLSTLFFSFAGLIFP